MNISKKILIPAFIVTLIVAWHLLMAMTAKISLAGVFRAKPTDGYVWTDAENSDARFFWQTASPRWKSGLEHSAFKVETADTEGVWNPLPGYEFVDKKKDLSTVWKHGAQHPDYMAWADHDEGMWIPVTGYKFVYEGDTFVASVWDPNKRYDDLKIMSLAQEGMYKPFPGYTFIEPGKSLKVIWMPGTVNWENSRLVAGRTEGSWDVNATRTVYRRGFSGRDGRVGAFAAGIVTGVVVDRVFLRRW